MSSVPQGIFGDPNVFDEKNAARYMGVSLSTLRRRRAARREPAFIQLDRRILYRKSELDKTLDDNTINPQEAPLDPPKPKRGPGTKKKVQ